MLTTPRIPVYSVFNQSLLKANMLALIFTIGVPDRDATGPFASPFSFSLSWLTHPLQSRFRSELSKSPVVDVAASSAIFCKACRRMSRDALYPDQYTFETARWNNLRSHN